MHLAQTARITLNIFSHAIGRATIGRDRKPVSALPFRHDVLPMVEKTNQSSDLEKQIAALRPHLVHRGTALRRVAIDALGALLVQDIDAIVLKELIALVRDHHAFIDARTQALSYLYRNEAVMVSLVRDSAAFSEARLDGSLFISPHLLTSVIRQMSDNPRVLLLIITNFDYNFKVRLTAAVHLAYMT